MSNTDVTNPGCVNVANQGDGRLSVDQPVLVSPSSNPGSATPAPAGGPSSSAAVASVTNPGTVNVANESFGKGLPKNVNVA
jgi:hypothetical protein